MLKFTLKFLVVFIAALFFVSCSKKEENKTSTNQPPKQQTQTQNQTISKPEMVDFSWKENGKDIKLSDYKGKVIVLNFWATWCGPCKREIPALSEIASELKNKDFKMIGVSVDEDKAVLTDFIKSFKFTYTVVHEPNEIFGKYMMATGQRQNVIPQTYIIDKNGKVAEIIIGSRSKEDFLSLINKYL